MPLVRWQFRGLEEDQREPFLRMASIGALLINAVRPWPYTPVSLPKKEFMDRSKAIWGS